MRDTWLLQVCRELENHKDDIIAEYRAYVGTPFNGDGSDGTAASHSQKPKSVKEWLARATELSKAGAINEDDIDGAMEHDSPAQALQTLVEMATETTSNVPAQSDTPAENSLPSASLFTGNHADISIVGSASADKWQYLYVKQSGSKGKTGQLEDETCVHFPKTCALLRSLPSVMWMYNATRCTNGVCPFPPPNISPKEAAQPAGVAAFYKLAAGTVVPMHNGPTNQRLKCQVSTAITKILQNLRETVPVTCSKLALILQLFAARSRRAARRANHCRQRYPRVATRGDHGVRRLIPPFSRRKSCGTQLSLYHSFAHLLIMGVAMRA